MNNRLNLLRTVPPIWILSAALMAIAPTTALAQPAAVDTRFASLRVGDSEATVLHIMQSEPKEVQRSSLLGVEHSVLVFESGRTRHQFTFVAARLVAKSVATKPATWSLF
jgi:hypothetical protein